MRARGSAGDIETKGTEVKHTIEIIEYTDPYCTWCWGSEPVLRHLQEAYGDQLSIRFVMGGLVEDSRTFYTVL